MSTAEHHLSPDLLTVEQMAERLQVSERWLRREVAARRVPCSRLGNRIRFDADDYAQIIRDRKQATVSTGDTFGLTDRSRAVS